MSADAAPRRLGAPAYFACFSGIVWREVLRFLHQRERFPRRSCGRSCGCSSLPPDFARAGVSIIPPYQTYVLLRGVRHTGSRQDDFALQCDAIFALDGLRSRDGSYAHPMVSPFPRSFLLLSKLLGGVVVSLLQVYAFLIIAYYWEIEAPLAGYLIVLPALVLSGLMLGALALFMLCRSSTVREFAGVMNSSFPDVFPPLQRSIRSGASRNRARCCARNLPRKPFHHASRALRFALYGQLEPTSLAIVLGFAAAVSDGSYLRLPPLQGLLGRRASQGPEDGNMAASSLAASVIAASLMSFP